MAMRKKKRGSLNPRQIVFAKEYLVDLNATQAAIRAGYAAKDADVQGPRLLGNVRIAALIQDGMDERAARTGVTVDKVIRELARIGFSDMLDYASFSKYGVALNDSKTLSEDQARAISEVSQTVTQYGGSIKFKLHNKTDALQLLGRHLKLFIDRTEVTGPGGGPVQVWTIGNRKITF